MTATIDAALEHREAEPSPVALRPHRDAEAQWALDVWTARAHRLAGSAQRAVHVFPEVADARFSIDGVPEAPELDIECTVLPGEDTAAVIETITCKVVEDLEMLLGAEFSSRRVTVSVDREAGSPAWQGLGLAV